MRCVALMLRGSSTVDTLDDFVQPIDILEVFEKSFMKFWSKIMFMVSKTEEYDQMKLCSIVFVMKIINLHILSFQIFNIFLLKFYTKSYVKMLINAM